MRSSGPAMVAEYGDSTLAKFMQAKAGADGQSAVSDIVVSGTGRYLPSRILDNAALELLVDTSDAWIVERTGIRERHIAGPGETTSEMAYRAATIACDQAEVATADLDLIIVATVTGETHFPATSCWLQAKLGSFKAWVLDVTMGCSGFLYAVRLAVSLMRTGHAHTTLVVGADRVSGLADYTDRQSCILFGDGAGAMVLRMQPAKSGAPAGFIADELYSDGRQANLLFRPLDAVATPDSPMVVSPGMPYLWMDGRAVYRSAVQNMEAAVRALLARVQLDLSAISWVVPHQANQRIIDALTQRLGISNAKVYSNIERCGNTSAASIPICLDEMNRNALIIPGDLILMCTFGTGFTWGATLLSWTNSVVTSAKTVEKSIVNRFSTS